VNEEDVVAQEVQLAQRALESIRPGFNADGADLLVRQITGRKLVVDLVVTSDTCMDCIVPTDILKAIVLATIREALPEIEEVEVHDPR
jgi:Fe-S cluster biogenesis protein NfuA